MSELIDKIDELCRHAGSIVAGFDRINDDLNSAIILSAKEGKQNGAGRNMLKDKLTDIQDKLFGRNTDNRCASPTEFKRVFEEQLFELELLKIYLESIYENNDRNKRTKDNGKRWLGWIYTVSNKCSVIETPSFRDEPIYKGPLQLYLDSSMDDIKEQYYNSNLRAGLFYLPYYARIHCIADIYVRVMDSVKSENYIEANDYLNALIDEVKECIQQSTSTYNHYNSWLFRASSLFRFCNRYAFAELANMTTFKHELFAFLTDVSVMISSINGYPIAAPQNTYYIRRKNPDVIRYYVFMIELYDMLFRHYLKQNDYIEAHFLLTCIRDIIKDIFPHYDRITQVALRLDDCRRNDTTAYDKGEILNDYLTIIRYVMEYLSKQLLMEQTDTTNKG